MVSADNLNLDVLEVIFACLHGNDLVSVALVSRSFFAGVIPKLYSTLLFKQSQAKRYPTVISPFATILSHPDLAIHVRKIDIRTIPKLKFQLHPGFLCECTKALELCGNLVSFTCTIDTLPPFLTRLQSKERLQDLRVNAAALTERQAAELIKLKVLKGIALDSPSWTILDKLPDWGKLNGRHLTNLTIYMAPELNETVLISALSHLPKLTGLHVVGCPKVDHVILLRYLENFPNLENLSFSTWESCRTLTAPYPHLPKLRHVAIDVRVTGGPAHFTTLLNALATFLRASSPSLRVFAVRLGDRQVLPDVFVKQICEANAGSLERLALLNCNVNIDTVKVIVKQCTALEVLEIAVPTQEFTSFSHALAHSKTLHTLIDIGEPHMSHSLRVALPSERIRYAITLVPNLSKIVTDGRVWTACVCNCMFKNVVLSVQRRKAATSIHWFMPRNQT